jgi:membrane protease subunit HflK
MASEIKERLQRYLDTYQTGITVTQVNVQNAAAPREVQEAFDDVIRAREDEQREKNQAETYAYGVVPEARGQAQRLLEDASGYREEVVSRAKGEADRFTKLVAEYRKAPEITRQRLYLDTMQDVFTNTSKIMMTGDKAQNSMVYLPLDKMMEGRTTINPSLPTVNAGNDGGVRVPAEPTARDLRSRENR